MSEEKICTYEKFESEQLNELYTALCKAQDKFDLAAQNSNNPFFKSKYSDFNSVVKASRKALCEQGLCILQRIITNGNDRMYLFTRLGHTSGQWIESKMYLNPSKQDIQSLGSLISYAKRYSYASLLGILSGAEEDDDGESASSPFRQQPPQNKGNHDVISKAQLQILNKALINHEDLIDRILTKNNIDKLADLPESKFNACLEAIQKITKSE